MADVAQVLAAPPTPVYLPAGAEERKRRTKIAEQLVSAGMDYSPVQSWTQGAARVAQALAGGVEESQLDRDERAAAARLQSLLLANPALGGMTAGAPSATPAAPTTAAPTSAAGGISAIESGGDYNKLGPVIEPGHQLAGDRAYGKYQVMGTNVGPWTKKYYGRELTPQEFLANPDAQEAVFKGEFGRLSSQYGPEGASRAWFAGPRGMNNLNRTDQLGTTVGGYGQKFAALTTGATDAGPSAPPASNLVPANSPGVFGPDAVMTGGPPAPQAVAAGPAPAPAAATTAPTSAAPVRAQTQMDPKMGAYIQVLIRSGDPAAMAYGQKLLEQFSKPPELKPVVAGDVAYAFDPATGKFGNPQQVNKPPPALDIANEMLKNPQKYGFKGPDDPALAEAVRQRLSGQSTSIAISNVQHPVLEGVGKQIVEQRKAAQGAAYDLIPQIHDARRALDAGVVTGAFAEPRVFAQKVAGLLGLPTDTAANTEVFRSAVGNQVLGHIKALGANPSNADRDYIEKVMGGQIQLEESSLRKILDISEKYARQSIRNFNRDSKKLIDADPNAYRGVSPLMQFEEPPEYVKQGGGTAPASTAPAGTPSVRKYNPATGTFE